MRSWDALPNVPLQFDGPVTAALIARGISDFRAAGRYLQALPYGRTANRADFGAVLREGRGTCSTKHALLATLAHEAATARDAHLGHQHWVSKNAETIEGRTFEEVWRIREECIGALAQ